MKKSVKLNLPNENFWNSTLYVSSVSRKKEKYKILRHFVQLGESKEEIIMRTFYIWDLLKHGRIWNQDRIIIPKKTLLKLYEKPTPVIKKFHSMNVRKYTLCDCFLNKFIYGDKPTKCKENIAASEIVLLYKSKYNKSVRTHKPFHESKQRTYKSLGNLLKNK